MILFIVSTFGCWAIATAIGFKAALAQSKREAYVWSFWDGGMLMRGKETKPVIVLAIAAGLAIVPFIGWLFVLALAL